MLPLRQRLRRDDAGFGLIEAVVALLIAGIVFSALATTLVASVQASLFGRQNQQATDFMTREIEKLRSADFGALSNVNSDVLGDPRLAACAAGPLCLSVNGVGERVVEATLGAASPHTSVLNGAETNQTAFTVSRYITKIADQPVDRARRATVYITWRSKGALKSRSISTIIAYTQRGLPLPVFKLLLPVPTQSVNPGARVTHKLELINQGATDRWNLTLTGATGGWNLYADTDGNGALDVATDLSVVDTTADGIVDTGRLDPSTTFPFFLTRLTPGSEPLGTTATTITATSVGQPAAAGAAKSVVATTVVTAGAVGPPPPPPPPSPSPETTCPAPSAEVASTQGSYTLRQFVLHSDGVGDTVLQPQMYLSAAAGDEPGLGRFSTDVDATVTGRILAPTGPSVPTTASVIGLTDPRKFADWALQFGSEGKVDGSAVLRLWAARQGAGAAPVSVRVVLYSATGGPAGLMRTVLAEKDISLGALSCAGFQEFYVRLPDVSQKVIPASRWLGVRVVTWGTDSVRFGYDVPSQFPASFTMGTK